MQAQKLVHVHADPAADYCLVNRLASADAWMSQFAIPPHAYNRLDVLCPGCCCQKALSSLCLCPQRVSQASWATPDDPLAFISIFSLLVGLSPPPWSPTCLHLQRQGNGAHEGQS